MKPLKFHYSNPYNSQSVKNSFLYNYLPKNLVESKAAADLVVEYVHKKITQQFKSSPKKILVAGENLYYRINLFKILEYFSKKTKINLTLLNKILPKKLLDSKFNYLRPKYLKYVKIISKNPKKGEYAIVTNNIKGKNILVLPFFLQVKYVKDNLNKLVKKNQIKKVPKKFCCIIISNESAFDRIDFVKKLSKYKNVDIYGKTSLTNSDNSQLPKHWDENPKFYSKYKFVICFENSFAEEYITEKLPNVMLGKSVPIYRGAPNIRDYFNTKSFINFDDYGSYEKMIKKIIELDKDDKKYLEFINRPWMNNVNMGKIKLKEEDLKNFIRRIMKF